MCQPVRLLIQLRVAKRQPLILDGDCFRRSPDLLFEQLVNAAITRIRRSRAIPLHHDAIALGRGQDVDIPDERPGGMRQRIHQPRQRRLHQIADVLRLDRRTHLRLQCKSSSQVVDRQGQRIVRSVVGIQRSDLSPSALTKRSFKAPCPDLRITVVQQAREQRCGCRNCTTSLRERERGVLVAQQHPQPLMCGPHRLLHALLADRQPHRQRVHEQSHALLGTFGAVQPTKQYRPEHDVFQSYKPRQYLTPGQMTEARRTDSRRARARTHLL